MAKTSYGLPYKGNPDFRGFVSAVDPGFLSIVGNNGGVNTAKLRSQGGIEGKLASYTPRGAIQRVNQLVKAFNVYQSKAPKGGGYNATYSGGGGSSSSGATPQEIAAYTQAIGNTQSALNRLGRTQASGQSEVNASYQNALNQLLQGKNRAQTQYSTNKQQTAQDYISAKNTIGNNAGNSLRGLQRLLGSKGAGGSSAYQINAPQAVTREATIQRNDAGSAYGKNVSALDTTWNNYLQDYGNNVLDVKKQRESQLRTLNSSIANNRATLLQNLGKLVSQRASAQGGNGVAAAQPYLNQANRILNKSASYKVAPIDYKVKAYQAPDLSTYTTSPSTIGATNQGQASSTDYFSPYLAALLGKDNKNPNSLLYG